MNRVTCSFVIAGAAAILSSCGQSGSVSENSSKPAPSHSSQAAAATPAVHVTKSGIEMVRLPGGEFMMGSAQGNPDEAPPHKVQVSAFLIDKFEVTHEMFAKAQLPNPSHWQDNPKKPVERVRWRDAKQYCNERSLLDGLKPCYNEKSMDWDCDFSADGYRLPTEAEWEYAARAGGEGIPEVYQPDKLRQFAWFTGNADQTTHAVGQKKPNRWGLADMFGNVSEWCEDVYSPAFYKESAGSNPRGPANPGKDVKRVIRGGSWKSGADACRPTARQGEPTGDSDACFSTDYCGFRCVRREAELHGGSVRELRPVKPASDSLSPGERAGVRANLWITNFFFDGGKLALTLALSPREREFKRSHRLKFLSAPVTGQGCGEEASSASITNGQNEGNSMGSAEASPYRGFSGG